MFERTEGNPEKGVRRSKSAKASLQALKGTEQEAGGLEDSSSGSVVISVEDVKKSWLKAFTYLFLFCKSQMLLTHVRLKFNLHACAALAKALEESRAAAHKSWVVRQFGSVQS